MARRGFFAELQHQSRVAARERDRAQAAFVREHNAAVRRTEQAQRAGARAQAQMSRADAAERKRLEKEAREAHVAAMEADAEARNLELAQIFEEIDSLLQATLAVDDYVDLESLRVAAEHPPFERPDLEAPTEPPRPVPDPPEPVYEAPPPPSGLGGLFGKRKHAEATAAAEAAHEAAAAQWRNQTQEAVRLRNAVADEHARAAAERVAALAVERDRYAAECEAREEMAAQRGAELDRLIANLGYGTVDAVQEYLSIVLSHSIYPDHFMVSHDFTFEPSTAELHLRAIVPAPETVPAIKAYKYAKASDEITTVALPARDVKARYSGAVHQVALRSLHEVFEADRRALIRTISLEVGTKTTDRATGRDTYVPFVAVGAERSAFMEIDLAAVVPTATLAHLGAAVSKDPFNLLPAVSTGVRRA